MARDHFQECFDFLCDNIDGAHKLRFNQTFIQEQNDYFSQIFELHGKKSKALLVEWIGKQSGYVDFKHYVTSTVFQKELKYKKILQQTDLTDKRIQQPEPDRRFAEKTKKLVEQYDLYFKYLRYYKLLGTYSSTAFAESVLSYYESRGYLTPSQQECFENCVQQLEKKWLNYQTLLQQHSDLTIDEVIELARGYV